MISGVNEHLLSQLYKYEPVWLEELVDEGKIYELRKFAKKG